MAVIWWWVGVLVLVAGVLVALLGWRVRRIGRAAATVPVAHLDRVRRLPAYRRLALAEWNRGRIHLACLGLALVGAALLSARLVGVDDDSEQMRTRDVVLCLDVSRSMAQVDLDIVDTWLALVEDLDEERIGFVMFDAYAVTGFPLTTDHDYVVQQLRAARQTIAAGRVAGVSAPDVGTSLIGDGLMTCAQHFDSTDTTRSRTIVVGTDNLVSGDQLYTVAEAAERAATERIMVFAVMPEGTPAEAETELVNATAATDGAVLAIRPGVATNVATISSAVKAQTKHAIMATAQESNFEQILPGSAMLLVGLAGALAATWRRP